MSLSIGAILLLYFFAISLQVCERAYYGPQQTNLKNNHFVIVVCSYNNKNVYKKNLQSIFCQDYSDYHVVYIDDNSPDGTYEAVLGYINEHSLSHKITLIHNPVNTRQLRNTYYAIHNFSNDDDIIIILDGDDWFINDKVLSALNSIYQDPKIWMTYGNYLQDKGYLVVPNFRKPHTYDTANLRIKHATPPPHLRSFYSWLFKQIHLEDLMSEGAFIPMAADMAYLFPMLEMAQNHHLPIQQVFYIYNTSGALNCYHNNESKKLQAKYSKIVQQKKTYPALEKALHINKIIINTNKRNLFSDTEYMQFNKVMTDTHAAVFTIAYIENTVEQKPLHTTYLYDHYWSYQLGFKPQLPYEFKVIAHIMNPAYEQNKQLVQLIEDSPNALPLSPNSKLENLVGILWLKNPV